MSSFQTVQNQIDWARECINNAHAAAGTYFESDAFVRRVEIDPKTGERVDKIALVKDPPSTIEGPLRNAILDLKHSFDQSLFFAARAMGFERFNANFPWADSKSGFDGIIRRRQLDKKTMLPQVLIDEIERHGPYSTGPEPPNPEYLIREIAQLANDKHNIGITHSLEVSSVTFNAPMSFFGAASLSRPWDPVKKEVEICRLAPDTIATYNDPILNWNMFFNRAGIVGEIPAFDVARIFADKAQTVLNDLKAISSG
jgi:hypothetical protein